MSGKTKSGTRTALSLGALLLWSLVVLGCGSTRDEFVFGPVGPDPTLSTGDVRFEFVRGRIVAPGNVARCRFEFSEQPAQSGTIDKATPKLATALRDYQDTIVITGVPTASRSVIVTYLDDEGVPIRQFWRAIEIFAGQETVVTDLGEGRPVEAESLSVLPARAELILGQEQQFRCEVVFDDGTELQAQRLRGLEWSSEPLEVCPIDENGLASAESVGEARIEARYQGLNASSEVSVGVGEFVGIVLRAAPDTAVAVGETLEFQANPLYQSSTATGENPLYEGSWSDPGSPTDEPDVTFRVAGDPYLEIENIPGEDNDSSRVVGTALQEGTTTVMAQVEIDGQTFTAERRCVISNSTFRIGGRTPSQGLVLPNNGLRLPLVLEELREGEEPQEFVTGQALAEAGYRFEVSDDDDYTWRDLDSDGDGIGDLDSDGHDFLDLDSDGDGIPTLAANCQFCETDPLANVSTVLLIAGGGDSGGDGDDTPGGIVARFPIEVTNSPPTALRFFVEGEEVGVDVEAAEIFEGQEKAFRVLLELEGDRSVDITSCPQLAYGGLDPADGDAFDEEYLEAIDFGRILRGLHETPHGDPFQPAQAHCTLSYGLDEGENSSPVSLREAFSVFVFGQR